MTIGSMEIWKAEILSIGTEIIMGVITDTNASFIADKLPGLGIGNYWATAVGDNMDRITEALDRGLSRSDIIITTGGLGPTDDDMTREAIAKVLGEEPEVVPDLVETLKARFGNRPMPDRNYKQATLIPSARPINNPRGTAPGWWTEKDGKVIISMPGVPREMFQMWDNEVVPSLQQRMAGRGNAIVTRTIKTLGIGEGNLDELIDTHLDSTNPKIGVYARVDGVHVRVNALGKTEADARAVLEPMEDTLTDLLRPYIWGHDADTIPVVIQRELVQKGMSLAIMESCTGGHVSDALTDVPDTSQYFKGGIIAYEPHTLVDNGVPSWTIDDHGYISGETAVAMAQAAREKLGADVGIGITGVPGPDEIEGKPVGTVFIAIADSKDSQVRQSNFPQNRQDMKWRATNATLFELLNWVHR